MRKNFDYVEIADYNADMDRLAADAVAILERAKREKNDLLQLLAAAAISSEDDLRIHDGALARVNLYELIMRRDEEMGGIRISVRPKK